MVHDNPIHMLSHEHQYIMKVVNGLQALAETLNAGDAVDVDLIFRSVGFMRDFADKCHHAKEEAILFPAMEAKGVPGEGCPLTALRNEHEQGRALVTQLAQAAERYAAGDGSAAQQMNDAITGICQLYPNHIWKEDEMVFPMTQRLFSAEEMAALQRDFDRAEAEFGHDHDLYVAFADEMASRYAK